MKNIFVVAMLVTTFCSEASRAYDPNTVESGTCTVVEYHQDGSSTPYKFPRNNSLNMSIQEPDPELCAYYMVYDLLLDYDAETFDLWRLQALGNLPSDPFEIVRFRNLAWKRTALQGLSMGVLSVQHVSEDGQIVNCSIDAQKLDREILIDEATHKAYLTEVQKVIQGVDLDDEEDLRGLFDEKAEDIQRLREIVRSTVQSKTTITCK